MKKRWIGNQGEEHGRAEGGRFCKMLEMPVVNIYLKKEEEHRVMYKSRERWK